MDKTQVGMAVGKIPSGACIATAAHSGVRSGLLASWIQQIAFEPLMVCMAVKAGRPIEALIDGSDRFVLNVVGKNSQALFKRFAKGFGPGEDPFGDLALEESESGPVLKDAVAHMECRVSAKHKAGDHNVYFAEVVGGAASREAEPFVHIRESGLSY